MKQRISAIIIVAVILAIAIALPTGITRIFAGWDGSPLYAYPSITTSEKEAPLGGHTLEWMWRLNDCEVSLSKEGKTLTVGTDDTCFGVAQLKMVVPDGADPGSCEILKDGDPYIIPTYVSNSIPPHVYTFLVNLFGFDGNYSVSCE